MGGKAKAPPPPDYGPIAAASKESAELSYKLGKEQLNWARDQYAQDKATTDRVVNSTLRTQDLQNNAAANDRARYENIYQPLEDNLVADASSYSTNERKDQEMGKAMATVGQTFDAQRNAATQKLESFGIDPSSTRYAALDLGSRVQKAAAQAGAANQTSQVVDATGRALRSEAINVGRGYPGQVAQTYGTALQAGNSAVQNNLNQTAMGAQTMGTATQWQGLGNQALGVWGNTLNMGFQNQLDAYKANQASSSGVGSALGLIGGLATGFMGFAEGGHVPDAQEGGAIPMGASPSGGAITDDVPAHGPTGPIRLNGGEFIIPRDVVEWRGEQWAQKEIQKARQEMQTGKHAQPESKPALPSQQRQAIPV